MAIAMGAVLVTAGLVATTVVQLAVARAHLGSFADLAAIAAGQDPWNPCGAAQQIAQANSVELALCEVGSDHVYVAVRKSTQGMGVAQAVLGDLQVGARATRIAG